MWQVDGCVSGTRKLLILDFIIFTFTGDVGVSIMVFSWRADAVSLPSFPNS